MWPTVFSASSTSINLTGCRNDDVGAAALSDVLSDVVTLRWAVTPVAKEATSLTSIGAQQQSKERKVQKWLDAC